MPVPSMLTQSHLANTALQPPRAAYAACLPCKSLGRTDCDRLQPSCTTCATRLTMCSYSNNTSINFKEVETRLKKLEAQLNPQKQLSKQGSSGQHAEQSNKADIAGGTVQQQQQQQPQFSLGEEGGGLCIDTKITEAHHFIKLLFNSIDLELVRRRAQNIFNTPLPIAQPPNSSLGMESTNALAILRDIMTTRDPIEGEWLDTVWQTRHHRCFIVYQMVDKHQMKIALLPTDERDLLLNMSIRAYMYHHENDLHQDTEYHIQSQKGDDYLLYAEELLERCYMSSHRTTIRALLHLFSFHIHDERPDKAFQYSDLALRMAQDLKLNTQYLDEDDRRLWWSTYWCHLHTVVEYDRPNFVTDQDCDRVPWPSRQAHEGFDTEYCLNYCIMSIQLLRIRKRIAQALRSKYMSVNDLLKQVSRLENDLDQWYKRVPDCNTTEPAASPLCMELHVLLHAQYSSEKMQMHQCFLENATALSLVALKECAKSAGSVADKMLEAAPIMRMCTCARAMPAIRRSVAFYLSNFMPNSPTFLANEAKEKLKQWMTVLNSHSFVYLPESQALVAKLSIVLSEKLNSVSSPGGDTTQSGTTRSDGNTRSVTSNNTNSNYSSGNNSNNNNNNNNNNNDDTNYYYDGTDSTPHTSSFHFDEPPPHHQQQQAAQSSPLVPAPHPSMLKRSYKEPDLLFAKQSMGPVVGKVIQQSNPVINNNFDNYYTPPVVQHVPQRQQGRSSVPTGPQAEAYNYVAEPLNFMPTTMPTTNYMPPQPPPAGADPYLTPVPTAPLILPSSIDTQWPLYQTGPLTTNVLMQQQQQQYNDLLQYPIQPQQQPPSQSMSQPIQWPGSYYAWM